MGEIGTVQRANVYQCFGSDSFFSPTHLLKPPGTELLHSIQPMTALFAYRRIGDIGIMAIDSHSLGFRTAIDELVNSMRFAKRLKDDHRRIYVGC